MYCSNSLRIVLICIVSTGTPSILFTLENNTRYLDSYCLAEITRQISSIISKSWKQSAPELSGFNP